MIKFVFWAMISLITIQPTVVFSQIVTGNMLSDWCSGFPEKYNPRCDTYIIGVIDGIAIGAIRSIATLQPNVEDDWTERYNRIIAYCFPNGATYAQIAKVVAQYLGENPNELHRDARALVQVSLAEAFPCKEKP